MAGNEIYIAEYLFNNIGKVILNHIGLIKEIGAPTGTNGYAKVKSLKDIKKISTQAASKKADIYVNGFGVSLKQLGASFSYNRIQRSEIISTLKLLKFKNPGSILTKIDKTVDDFHKGLLITRSVPWSNLFKEIDFKKLLKYLMMDGSPNLGFSSHPANYILEAPGVSIDSSNISVYDFDEYFNKYKNKLCIAIRRQWVGQSSNSEHNRALGISKKLENKKWVYANISGSPRKQKTSGLIWRNEFLEAERRTVFLLFIEKIS